MKVLLVIPSLEYGGAARQVTLLAAGLPSVFRCISRGLNPKLF